MKISISLLPKLDRVDTSVDLAVVIDVLRATSVIATALASGATRVMTCREISTATEIASRTAPRPLLCGERQCRPIDGFDLGNSPSEYTRQRVGGRQVVLTTTNGTAAIESALPARRLVTASFLNFFAVIEAMRTADRVHLVCAGTDGEVTLEDVLLAGALLTHCQQMAGGQPATDQTVLAGQLWRSWFGEQQLPETQTLSARLRETRGGRNLVERGYADDLPHCAAIGSLDILPERVHDDPVTFEPLGK